MKYPDNAWTLLSNIIKEGEGGDFYRILWKEEGMGNNLMKHR